LATTADPVVDGVISLKKGSETLTTEVSPDGAYLIGPLAPGEWEVQVQDARSVSGDLAGLTQKVDFPRPRLDREMVPFGAIDMAWLSDTLRDQLILRPHRQFQFYFDGAGLTSPTVRGVRELFKVWAGIELPELGLMVEGENGQELFGGAVQGPPQISPVILGGGFPEPMTPHTILVRASTNVAKVNTNGNYHWQTGESLGGFIEFNRDCSDCISKVAAGLWELVFFRRARESGTTPSGVPGSWTQFTGDPKQLSSTALDRLYWKAVERFPTGSQVAEGEVNAAKETPPPEEDDSNRPPVIPSQSFTVAEHSGFGTVVGKVVASDPDEADVLSYAITGGTRLPKPALRLHPPSTPCPSR
jgi:hypothetical protein